MLEVEVSYGHGRRQGGAGGAMAPPGFSHTLSKSSQISKILPFLVVNTGSILIGPPLKIFLPTPLVTADFFQNRMCEAENRRFFPQVWNNNDWRKGWKTEVLECFRVNRSLVLN